MQFLTCKLFLKISFSARSLPRCQYTPINNNEYEIEDVGYFAYNQFLTQEEQTGYLVGWEGCMAEDSLSFADAFKAKVVESGETHDTFGPVLDKVQAKIFMGKNGDMALRLGRYKLVRFVPPKDIRTGITRQHQVNHEGPNWEGADESQRCTYDPLGVAQNPNTCTVEPLCRQHTSWGNTYCLRDHYYQLWDLEQNFGEKMLCKNDELSHLLKVSNEKYLV